MDVKFIDKKYIDSAFTSKSNEYQLLAKYIEKRCVTHHDGQQSNLKLLQAKEKLLALLPECHSMNDIVAALNAYRDQTIQAEGNNKSENPNAFLTKIDHINALYKYGCLTYNTALAVMEHQNPKAIANAFVWLYWIGCLTEDNTQAVMEHQNPEAIANAFGWLYWAGCLNEDSALTVMEHQNPEAIANAFGWLYWAGCLTKDNAQTVMEHQNPEAITNIFSRLFGAGYLTGDNALMVIAHPDPKAVTDALSRLDEAGCLTRDNALTVIAHPDPKPLTEALVRLDTAGCLTEENRQVVIAHKNPEALVNPFTWLYWTGCLTGDNALTVIKHQNPEALANAFAWLYGAGCLTANNVLMVIAHPDPKAVTDALSRLNEAGCLTLENAHRVLHLPVYTNESVLVALSELDDYLLTPDLFAQIAQLAESAPDDVELIIDLLDHIGSTALSDHLNNPNPFIQQQQSLEQLLQDFYMTAGVEKPFDFTAFSKEKNNGKNRMEWQIFLNLLYSSNDYKNNQPYEVRKGFARQITDLIQAVSIDKELMEKVHEFVKDSAEHCQDRSVVNLSNAVMIMNLHGLLQFGSASANDLIDFFQGKTLLEALDHMAIKLAKEKNNKDESAETVLKLRLALKNEFKLPVKGTGMLYEASSEVAQQDISLVREELQNIRDHPAIMVNILVSNDLWQKSLPQIITLIKDDKVKQKLHRIGQNHQEEKQRILGMMSAIDELQDDLNKADLLKNQINAKENEKGTGLPKTEHAQLNILKKQLLELSGSINEVLVKYDLKTLENYGSNAYFEMVMFLDSKYKKNEDDYIKNQTKLLLKIRDSQEYFPTLK